MKKKTGMTHLYTGLLAAGVIFVATTAQAAMFNLSKDQVSDAVKHGKSSFEQHPTVFMWPYFKVTGYGYPTALLRTEYFAVADYVRRAEFQRKYGSQKAHKLTDKRIEDARNEVAGVLQFVVTVYGPDKGFMNDYNFHLVSSGKKISPKAVDKPAEATTSGFSGKLGYTANVIVDFPGDAVTGKEKIALIVQPPKGSGPSGARNGSFKVPYDLGAVK